MTNKITVCALGADGNETIFTEIDPKETLGDFKKRMTNAGVGDEYSLSIVGISVNPHGSSVCPMVSCLYAIDDDENADNSCGDGISLDYILETLRNQNNTSTQEGTPFALSSEGILAIKSIESDFSYPLTSTYGLPQVLAVTMVEVAGSVVLSRAWAQLMVSEQNSNALYQNTSSIIKHHGCPEFMDDLRNREKCVGGCWFGSAPNRTLFNASFAALCGELIDTRDGYAASSGGAILGLGLVMVGLMALMVSGAYFYTQQYSSAKRLHLGRVQQMHEITDVLDEPDTLSNISNRKLLSLKGHLEYFLLLQNKHFNRGTILDDSTSMDDPFREFLSNINDELGKRRSETSKSCCWPNSLWCSTQQTDHSRDDDISLEDT